MTVAATDLRQQFLAGMSHVATTVNVITSDGVSGLAGVTVSAMASVSADTPKPTLLVCVHHHASAANKIIENGIFCVNILRDDQTVISDTFAGRTAEQGVDRFNVTHWVKMKSGCPRLLNPLVSFDCTVVSSNRVGSHFVFFGEVEDVFMGEPGSPLIYAHRAYGTPARIGAEVKTA